MVLISEARRPRRAKSCKYRHGGRHYDTRFMGSFKVLASTYITLIGCTAKSTFPLGTNPLLAPSSDSFLWRKFTGSAS